MLFFYATAIAGGFAFLNAHSSRCMFFKMLKWFGCKPGLDKSEVIRKLMVTVAVEPDFFLVLSHDGLLMLLVVLTWCLIFANNLENVTQYTGSVCSFV